MIYAIRKCKPVKGVHRLTEFRSYKQFDEPMFLNDLSNVPWHVVKNCDNVNDALDLWQSLLCKVVDKHIPKKVKRVRGTPSPWLNSNILNHMSTRDFLHRKAIRSSLKSDWDTYKSYRNKVTLMIRKSKEYYFKNTVQQGIGNSGKMWKALNDILPSKSSSTPSSIVVNGNVLSGNEDIANGFNDHFSSVADVLIKDNFVASSTSNVNRVDHSNVTPNVSNPKLNLPCISHEFVNSEILRMSTKKATGLDDIAAKYLNLLDLSLWTVLLSL